MVLNMGAFYEGQQANDQKRRAQRKENAALYAEFVRMNPDSSVTQREDYVNTLGADSKFVRAALPTRDVMQSNVDRRKRAVASAAKERELKTLRDRLSFMDDATNIYSSTYLSTGDEAKAKESLSIFSDYLDENMMGAVSVAGKASAEEKFDKTFAPTYQAWVQNGAVGDTEAWRSLAPTPEFLTKHMNNANAYKANLGQNQFVTALSEVNNLGSNDDPAAQENWASTMKERFPFLSPDKIKILEDGLDKAEAQRSERASKALNASANQVVETIVSQITNEEDPEFENLQNDAGIEAAIRAQFANDPKLAEMVDISDHVERVKTAVTEAQKAVVRKLDNAEEKARLVAEQLDQQYRFDPQYKNRDGDTDEVEGNKQAMAALSALDTIAPVPKNADAAEEKIARDDFKKEIESKVQASAMDFNISIKDHDAYRSILSSVAGAMKNDGMAEYNELFFLKAVHEQLSVGQGNEAVSYRSTLAELGINSIEDMIDARFGLDLGANREEFKQTFERRRGQRIEMLTDLYDTGRNTLEDVNKGIIGDTQEVKVLVANLDKGNELREPSRLGGSPILSVQDMDKVRTMQGTIGNDIMQMADKLDELDQSILSAKAYLKIKEFAVDPSLQANRESINGSIEEMNKQRALLISQMDRFSKTHDDLEAPIEALKTSPMNKPQEAIKLTAMALAETLRRSGDGDNETLIRDMVNDLMKEDIAKTKTIRAEQNINAEQNYRREVNMYRDALVQATLDALQ